MARSASRTAGYQKTIRHLLAHTLCHGKHTVTQLLRTAGQQHSDWSADYRLYSTQLQAPALFEPIIKGVDALLNEEQPLVLAVDDSMMGKTGRKIPGAGWHRDSLSPAFHTNLKFSMKFVQLSAAVHPLDHPECARLIPVAFELIPKLPKLSLEPSPQERARHRANSPSKDKQIPWQTCTLDKRGKQTTFRFKHIAQARSRITGEKAIIQVVVIAGLRYKKRKNASWSYTRPAHVPHSTWQRFALSVTASCRPPSLCPNGASTSHRADLQHWT